MASAPHKTTQQVQAEVWLTWIISSRGAELEGSQSVVVQGCGERWNFFGQRSERILIVKFRKKGLRDRHQPRCGRCHLPKSPFKNLSLPLSLPLSPLSPHPNPLSRMYNLFHSADPPTPTKPNTDRTIHDGTPQPCFEINQTHLRIDTIKADDDRRLNMRYELTPPTTLPYLPPYLLSTPPTHSSQCFHSLICTHTSLRLSFSCPPLCFAFSVALIRLRVA